MSQLKNVVDLRKPMRTSSLSGPRLPFSDKKPRTPLRARRRRARIIAAVVTLILIGVLVWAVHAFSYLQRFNVGDISVVGADQVSPQDVEAFAQRTLYNAPHSFISHTNIFLYNPKTLAQNIVAAFPRVKSATVARDSFFGNQLIITLTERQPYALWCLPAQAGDPQNVCYQMDSDGSVFAQAPSTDASSTPPSPSGYVFSGALAASSSPIGQSFTPAHLPGIVAFLQLLGQSSFVPLGASVQSDQDFFVPLQQGFYIKASFGEDASTLIKNLQLILSSDVLQGQQQNLEYVDLRFGDKVYYKLNGEDQATAPAQ